MSIQCDVCGKKSLKAAKISFSHKQNVHRQFPNIQSVKVNLDGTVKRIKVCTSCLKAGKVQRAV
ncbi:MAG: 50S ribosomal protein L28 [Candidatus Gastranaerophilales bacterium]|nr:50S ribosomal protein L28 [Candidatus Gastranaerophilales bacterium]